MTSSASCNGNGCRDAGYDEEASSLINIRLNVADAGGGVISQLLMNVRYSRVESTKRTNISEHCGFSSCEWEFGRGFKPDLSSPALTRYLVLSSSLSRITVAE